MNRNMFVWARTEGCLSSSTFYQNAARYGNSSSSLRQLRSLVQRSVKTNLSNIVVERPGVKASQGFNDFVCSLTHLPVDSTRPIPGY